MALTYNGYYISPDTIGYQIKKKKQIPDMQIWFTYF